MALNYLFFIKSIILLIYFIFYFNLYGGKTTNILLTKKEKPMERLVQM